MRTRTVTPGEVDHEIDRGQLIQPAPQTIDTEVCEGIFQRHLENGDGSFIPDAEFCDLPKTAFLDYLARDRSVLLFGARRSDLTHLQPIVLSQNVIGWDRPRYVAFRSSIEAIYHAILDVDRLARLGHPVRSTIVMPEGYYFGVDYRALSAAPWAPGTVYCFRGTDFPENFLSEPFQPKRPVRPLARLNVTPTDWPMLNRVHGADIDAQITRQTESFLGYPWVEDDAVHPGRWKRPLVDAMRRRLDRSVGEPVGLVELGRIVGVGPSAALRLFRGVMGESPREYLTRLRVQEAKSLLKLGQAIAQVAADTGFCDQTHLNRHFQRLLGLTPGQYLRKQESPIHRA